MSLGIGASRALEQFVARRTWREFGGLKFQVCRVCFEVILGGRKYIGTAPIRHDAGPLMGWYVPTRTNFCSVHVSS
jgi:hypothetical protein